MRWLALLALTSSAAAAQTPAPAGPVPVDPVAFDCAAAIQRGCAI